MKSQPSNRLRAVLRNLTPSFIAGVLGTTSVPALAATLTWDVTPGTVGAGDSAITGGAGAWETSVSLGNWTSDGGASNVAWTNTSPPNSAVFSGAGGAISQNGATASSLTFNSSGYVITGNTVTLAGTTPTITANADATLSTILAGTAGMVKAGSGQLNLSTQATFTGGTTVNAGTLSLSGGGGNSGTIRGAVHVNNGAMLRLGAKDVTGHNPANFPLTSININEGSKLHVAVADNQTLGNATINLTGASITGVANGNIDFFHGNSTLHSFASPVSSTVAGPKLTIRQAGGVTFTVDNGSAPIDLDVNSVIASNTGFATQPFIKAGAGTLRLNGANTYTGPTTVNEGTLIFGASGILPAATGVTVNAAVLQLDAHGKSAGSLALNGGSTFIAPLKKSGAALTLGSALTTAGTVTLKPSFLDVPVSGDKYDIVSAGSFTDGATYVLDLTSKGATRVTGTVAADAEQFLVLEIATGSADLSWSNATSNGIWNHNGHANFTQGGSPDVFKTYDAVTFGDTGAGTVALDGTLYPVSTTVNSAAGHDYTFAGAGMIGGGSLVKSGASMLTLASAQAPEAVILNEGTLVLGHAGGIGQSATVTFTGGTLHNGTGAALATPVPFSCGGVLAFTGAPMSIGSVGLSADTEITTSMPSLTLGGAVAANGFKLTKKGSGAWLMNGASASSLNAGFDIVEGTVTVATGSGITTATVGGGSGSAELRCDGNTPRNRLADSAAVTIANHGKVTIAGVNALQIHGAACSFTVESGGELVVVSGASEATSPATSSHLHLMNLALNGGTVTLPYSGTGTAYNGESFLLQGGITTGGTSPSTIQFGNGAGTANAGFSLVGSAPHMINVADVTGDATADLIIQAEIENADAGAASWTKDGPGTLFLAGGIAHTNTGIITVANGTLKGTGSIAGPLFVQSPGTLAPGDSAGTFAAGATTLAGTYACEIDGNAADRLNVTGNLNLTGSTLAITVLGGGATKGSYLIATYTGSLTGTFNATGIPDGYSLDYGITGQVRLVSGSDPYGDWEAANHISGAGSGTDSDGDGIVNGVEFVLGGISDPASPGKNSSSLLPKITDLGASIRLDFHLSDAANSLSPAVWSVEFDDDLIAPWTPAVDPGNATISITADGNGPDGTPWSKVQVTIPKSGSKRFVRLNVNVP